jgi:phosphate/sulfate permease
MTNSKALWIIVALLAIIVAFFIANAISEAEQRSKDFDQSVRELEQSKEDLHDALRKKAYEDALKN